MLAEDLRSAGRARRAVRATLDDWGLAGLADAAVLVVSELVTNAVVHARSGPVLVLTARAGVLRIAVRDDAGGSAPRALAVDDDAVARPGARPRRGGQPPSGGWSSTPTAARASGASWSSRA